MTYLCNSIIRCVPGTATCCVASSSSVLISPFVASPRKKTYLGYNQVINYIRFRRRVCQRVLFECRTPRIIRLPSPWLLAWLHTTKQNEVMLFKISALRTIILNLTPVGKSNYTRDNVLFSVVNTFRDHSERLSFFLILFVFPINV